MDRPRLRPVTAIGVRGETMYIKDSGPPPMAAVQLPAGAPSEPGGDGSPGIAGPGCQEGEVVGAA